MAETTDSTDENISTEHQNAARVDLPNDTADPGEAPEGGLEQEDVEDRPNVGTVKPEDYPKNQPDA